MSRNKLGNLLPDLFAPTAKKGSPLDNLKQEGNFERDAAKELNVVQQSLADRREQEVKTIEARNDAEYWFCAVFPNRAACMEYLTKIGLDPDENISTGSS